MNQLPVNRCRLSVAGFPLISLTAFALGGLLSSCATQASPEGFKWGSSQSQVVKRMGKEPSQKETYTLVYPTVVGGFPLQKGFMFAENKLAVISYIYAEGDTAPAPSLHLFKLLSDSMTQRFGDGQDSLADGGAKAIRRWQTKTSQAQLYYFDNKVMLNYESKKYGPALQRQLESTPTEE